MIKIPLSLIAVALCCVPIFGQKGIDPQTQKIKEESNKTSRPTDVNRSFDWGKGKTQVRERLPNPYKLNARRDVLIETIRQVLKDKRLVIDEQSSRMGDGIIITQPWTLGKGPVISLSELRRYGILEYTDTAFSRAQYTLTIEVQPIDGISNNVSVNAKIEGRSGTGLMYEWVTIPSSGLAEEEFLTKLVEAVTGQSLDPVPTNN